MKLRGRLYQILSFLVLTPLVVMGNACGAGFKSGDLAALSALSASAPDGAAGLPVATPVPGSTPSSTPVSTATPAPAVCANQDIIQSHRLTEFRSEVDREYAAVVDNFSRVPGGMITSWRVQNSTGSEFQPKLILSDCTYQILTKTTDAGLCFDAGTEVGAGLTHEVCDINRASQRWQIQKIANDKFKLRVADGRCLEMKNLSSGNTQVRMQPCADTAEQRFALTKWTNGTLAPPLDSHVSTETAVAYNHGTSINEPTRSSGSFGIYFNETARSWEYPQPGAYVDYDVIADIGGEFSLQMIYASWFEGTGVNVTINGAAPLYLPLPAKDSGDPSRRVETNAFPIVLAKGVNKLRFSMPTDRFLPFTLNMFYIAHTNEKLTHVGEQTNISATEPTKFDIAKINRLYRFTLDSTLSERAWRYPHNVAHLEYRLNVARAGRYKVSVRYSSPSGQDRIALAVNGIRRISEYVEIAGRIFLPSTGDDMGQFRDSDATEINLPAGDVRLGFLADADAVSMYVREYAISAITVTPVP